MSRKISSVHMVCLAAVVALTAAGRKAESKQASYGTVRGTVVYTASRDAGAKPDTGARILLVVGRLVIERNQFAYATSDGRFAVRLNGKETLFNDDPPKPKCVYYKLAGDTMVDGNGNYSIPQLKPGAYTVILQSAHTRYTRDGESYARNVLGRLEQRIVTVKPGQSVDVSLDFGMDARLIGSPQLLLRALDRLAGSGQSQ